MWAPGAWRLTVPNRAVLAAALLCSGCSVEIGRLRSPAGTQDAALDQALTDDGSPGVDIGGVLDLGNVAGDADAPGIADLPADDRVATDGPAKEDLTRDVLVPVEPDAGAGEAGLADGGGTNADGGQDLDVGDGGLEAGDGDVQDGPDVPGTDLPDVPTAVFVQYPIPTVDSQPWGITVGSDSKLWFTERAGNKVGRVGATGSFDEYPLPSAGSAPWDIVLGPDGNVWFSENGASRIGRITTTGAITEYTLPGVGQTTNVGFKGITTSLFGSYLWFAESTGNKLGRLATTGGFTEFPLPAAASGPSQLVADPEEIGGYWFTESATNRLAHITINGQVAEVASLGDGAVPEGITIGPDGNVWFTLMGGNKIGRVAATGSGGPLLFGLPTPDGQPACITSGPDGNLWFTELAAGKIGRITPSGEITEFAIPGAGSAPRGIVTGPDGNVWFVESGANKVSYIVP